MWSKQVTIKTNVRREQIWALWTDVDSWNKWDNSIEFSKLNGVFEQGVYGVLKPFKSPKSKFQIISVDTLNEFTTRSLLPLAKMDFFHEMSEKDGCIYLTHGVKISGVFTFLFSRIIGQKIVNELPNAMNKLVEMAKKVSCE